jgi:outer membrane protein TolC
MKRPFKRPSGRWPTPWPYREPSTNAWPPSNRWSEATSETYRLSDMRYAKGIDNYLSVLDAHRSLYAAQQERVLLEREKLANQVRLYAVLGGGAK